MSKIVIDTNLINFKSINIESFFTDNTMYVTDNLIFETIKSSKDDSISADFKKFIPYKENIYFLDGIGEVIKKEIENLIPLTDIKEIAYPNNVYPLNCLFDIAIKEGINSECLVEDFKDILSKAQKYKEDMARELPIYYAELESFNLLNIFIRDGFGEDFAKSLKNSIRKYLKEILNDRYFKIGKELNINIENFLLKCSFLCRTILASITICLYYKKNGGILPKTEKLKNTIIDSSFFVYASYADILLTNDKLEKEIFNNYFIHLINLVSPAQIQSKACNRDELTSF